jgi:adenylyl-sulfate kinase
MSSQRAAVVPPSANSQELRRVTMAAQVPMTNTKEGLGKDPARGSVLWLTGLSGAGKTTISRRALELFVAAGNERALTIDGDDLRHGLCRDLGFSAEDRRENLRRASHLAALLADKGFVVIVALISPYRAHRDEARAVVGAARFELVYVRAPLEVCEARDPKGLYRRARAGELTAFTGISDPYEEPADADLVLETAACSIDEAAGRLLAHLKGRAARS